MFHRVLAPIIPLLALVLSAGCRPGVTVPASQVADLHGQKLNPFAGESWVNVLVFVAHDCPISNRYVPTLRSIRQQYTSDDVKFWLVYPDLDAANGEIREHLREYALAIPALRDPGRELVAAAQATTVPEAAVFVREGQRDRLVYHGRIDDRFVDFGVARPTSTIDDLQNVLQSVLSGDVRDFPAQPAVGCPIR